MGFLFSFVTILLQQSALSAAGVFRFNGFKSADLKLDGSATIISGGTLQLTSDAHVEAIGHAFFPLPIRFKRSLSSPSVLSFSTLFVFEISAGTPGISCHGLAFMLSPSSSIIGSSGNGFLGMLNATSNGNSSNHILAVEFDTCKDPFLEDIDDNHVGIDVNSLISNASASAGYFIDDNTDKFPINLQSGTRILAWVEYGSDNRELNVSISPITNPTKPKRPLLSQRIKLSSVLQDQMYVGFSSAVGILSGNHHILGWSFAINGEPAPVLDLRKLPSLPKSKTRVFVIIVAALGTVFLIVVFFAAIFYAVNKKRKKREESLADLLDGRELEFPHRFSYRDLHKATRGFRKERLLGSGGFGSVYKGIIPETKAVVAVKRVSDKANQRSKEFISEISSLGRLRHRNLVQLHGWCYRRDELLLVYDFMENGSLDSFLLDDEKATRLTWESRLKVLKGIAEGLLYLHEGWEQVVVHRDVKASNVLLDSEMNARLGDFGLARVQEHCQSPQDITGVMGTVGYMAPELSRTRKVTKCADVFAFGTLVLEVVTGKPPILRDEREDREKDMMLGEWVLKCLQRDDLVNVVDARLGGHYRKEEVDLALRIGVGCLAALPESRPAMRQVVQFLDGEASVQQFLSSQGLFFTKDFGQLDGDASSSSL